MTTAEKIREAPLINAGRQLTEREFYGIVWVDTELIVTGKYGRLVDFVEVDAPLVSSVIPFAGLEQEICALKHGKAVLDVPSVTIVTSAKRTPRLNLAVLWSDDAQGYLVLVSRAVISSDLEDELNRQIRARLIAEADLTVKSTELQRANRELERTNTDLEQFASIISHDLKSPLRELRHLTTDAELALDRGNLPAVSERLAAMRAQSQRMAQMLSALLSYATVGLKSDAYAIVATGELVRDVVRHLSRPSGITVMIEGHWPEIVTIAPTLDLVLRNLIDNALSHHDRVSGQVVVTAVDQGEELVITVTDDGPGISPHDQSAIFLPFRTLSQSTETASLGMGLSLVTRALNAVGARIQVSSDAPRTRGTTFRVYWPKAPPTAEKNSRRGPHDAVYSDD